jgi:alpha-tubulin suppressor-like RCC1 family protein
VDLAVQSRHGCAVLASGALYCWGHNENGKVGNGTAIDRHVPALIVADALRVAVGEQHTCALRAAGRVSCWGMGTEGQLGDGARTTSPVPVDVAGLDGVTRVALGIHDTCAVRSDGSVWCWGAVGGALASAVPGVADAREVAIANGTVCVLRSSKDVLCFGSDNNGQRGDGAAVPPPFPPALVPGLDEVEQLTAGDRHFCVRRSSGQVLCWGEGVNGQIGNGTGLAAMSPVNAPVSDATYLAAGYQANCAVRDGGAVTCWGTLSLPIGALPIARDVRALGVGYDVLCVLSSSGALECVGSDDYAQLGNGPLGGSSSLGPVALP